MSEIKKEILNPFGYLGIRSDKIRVLDDKEFIYMHINTYWIMEEKFKVPPKYPIHSIDVQLLTRFSAKVSGQTCTS